jgi:hypothetical protein
MPPIPSAPGDGSPDDGPGRQVLWIQPAAPPKPPVGAACNGCGVCCLAEPCPVGVLVSRRRRGACRALRWDADRARYLCGMASAPAEVLGRRWRWLAPWIGRRALRWISAGSGCDATLEVDPAGAPDASADADAGSGKGRGPGAGPASRR